MRNAIILHGTSSKEEFFSDKYPSLSNSHWLPWLQKQLLINHIPTQTPEIPEAYNPQYKLWEKEMNRYEVNENTILVGHSCGGGFLLRWLSENHLAPGKLLLVAPWLDPDRRKTTSFFDFQIDPSIGSRIKTHLFISTDDDQEILTSVEMITTKVEGISLHQFSNHGHFTFNQMKTDQFPELLEVALS